MTMKVHESTLPPACATAREGMHRVLDGDPVAVDVRRELEAHCAGCASCREVRAELQQIQSALHALPVRELPEADLQAVLERTTRTRLSARLAGWGLDWRTAAAAAALIAAIWAVWPTGPDPAEVERAREEARMVLMLTAQALRSTQKVGIRDVMTEEVSPALRRVPVALPGVPERKDL